MTALDAKLLPEVSAALAPLNARLAGLPGAPVRWVSGPYGATRPGDVELPDPWEDTTRSRLTRPDLYRNSAVTWLFSATCGPHAASAGDIHLAVTEWLAPTPDDYGPDTASAQPYIDRLRAKSPPSSVLTSSATWRRTPATRTGCPFHEVLSLFSSTPVPAPCPARSSPSPVRRRSPPGRSAG